MIFIPKALNKKKRNITISKKELKDFEIKVKSLYENKHIKSPIHLSGNNESQLIKIFSLISKEDYVFSTWRSHYHALLHGIPKEQILSMILSGKSMSISSKNFNFYSSSIVGGCVPIALGTALALKKKKSLKAVWCFVGDMSFETGIFHEAYKYSRNHSLKLNFIIEDNELSTNTPTKSVWKNKSSIPKDVIYYKYKRIYPHHGVGKWILF